MLDVPGCKYVLNRLSCISSEESHRKAFTAKFVDRFGNVDSFSSGIVFYFLDAVQSVWHELFDLYGLVDRRVHCYCYDHFFTPFL